MTEYKQDILDFLLPALQWTRACADLCSLEYDEEEEVVTAIFAQGSKKINVACDSGIAMIRDVLAHIE